MNGFTTGYAFWYGVTVLVTAWVSVSAIGNATENGKIPLYIGGMFSMSGGWDGSGCLMAAEYALEQINERSDIIPGYELRMTWGDTQCDPGRATRLLFNHTYSGDAPKIILLGPACSRSAHPVAAASPYYNLITVLYSATSASLRDRVKYPYVYRDVPNGVNVYNGPYLWLLKNYGWRKVGYIYDPNDAFTSRLADINRRTAALNVTIVSEVIDTNAENLIAKLKNDDIRIVFIDVFPEDARRILCEAYKVSFYGPDMFWALPGWYGDGWWAGDNRGTDCTADQIQEIVELSLPIGVDVSPISTVNDVTIAGITPREFSEEMRNRLSWPKYQAITENAYMSYSYDAVWSIALMLNRTAARLERLNTHVRLEDFTYTNSYLSEIFLQEFAAVKFFGASGDLAFINGERLGSSKISQIQGHCDPDWQISQRDCYIFMSDSEHERGMAGRSCANMGAELAEVDSIPKIQTLMDLWSSNNFDETSWIVGPAIPRDHSSNTTSKDDPEEPPTHGPDETTQNAGDQQSCSYIEFIEGLEAKLVEVACMEAGPFICRKSAVFNYVTVGTFDSVSEEMIWANDIAWAGGQVPSDGVPEVVIPVIDHVEKMTPSFVYILMVSFAACGAIASLALIVFVVKYSRNRAIAAANPVLCGVILLSTLLIFISVTIHKSEVISTLNDSQHANLCRVQSITFSIGFTLGVATLVTKIWKVYTEKAYTSKVVVYDWWLHLVISITVAVDIVLQIVIHAAFPTIVRRHILREEVDPDDIHHVTVFYNSVCTHEDILIPVFLASVDKTFLLLAGLFWTIEIRQAKFSVFEDGHLVAASIYNLVIFASCGLIITFLFPSSPTELYIFTSALALCCTVITLFIIFLPKILYLLKEPTTQPAENRVTMTTSSSGQPCSSHGRNPPPALVEENKRLRAQYSKLQELQKRLQRVRRIP